MRYLLVAALFGGTPAGGAVGPDDRPECSSTFPKPHDPSAHVDGEGGDPLWLARIAGDEVARALGMGPEQTFTASARVSALNDGITSLNQKLQAAGFEPIAISFYHGEVTPSSNQLESQGLTLPIRTDSISDISHAPVLIVLAPARLRVWLNSIVFTLQFLEQADAIDPAEHKVCAENFSEKFAKMGGLVRALASLRARAGGLIDDPAQGPGRFAEFILEQAVRDAGLDLSPVEYARAICSPSLEAKLSQFLATRERWSAAASALPIIQIPPLDLDLMSPHLTRTPAQLVAAEIANEVEQRVRELKTALGVSPNSSLNSSPQDRDPDPAHPHAPENGI